MNRNVNKGKMTEIETYWNQLRDRLAELGIQVDKHLHHSTNHKFTGLEFLGGAELLFLWLESWGREGMRVRRWIVWRIAEEGKDEMLRNAQGTGDKELNARIEEDFLMLKMWARGRERLGADGWNRWGQYYEEKWEKRERGAVAKMAMKYVMDACESIQCMNTKRAAESLESFGVCALDMVEQFEKEITGEKEFVGLEAKRKEVKRWIENIIKKESTRNGIECGILPHLFHDYDPYLQIGDERPELEKYISAGVPKGEAMGWFLMGVSPEEVVRMAIDGRI